MADIKKKRSLAYKFCKDGKVKELKSIEVQNIGDFEDCVGVALEFGRLEIFKILLKSGTNEEQVM